VTALGFITRWKSIQLSEKRAVLPIILAVNQEKPLQNDGVPVETSHVLLNIGNHYLMMMLMMMILPLLLKMMIMTMMMVVVRRDKHFSPYIRSLSLNSVFLLHKTSRTHRAPSNSDSKALRPTYPSSYFN